MGVQNELRQDAALFSLYFYFLLVSARGVPPVSASCNSADEQIQQRLGRRVYHVMTNVVSERFTCVHVHLHQYHHLKVQPVDIIYLPAWQRAGNGSRIS